MSTSYDGLQFPIHPENHKPSTSSTGKQIIAEAIVLEAKVFLKNPKYSVSDVVTELNFIDTSVFSKFFKNYAGVSPRTFIASN